MRFLRSIPALLLALSLMPSQAFAGTTGGITGRVVDSQTQAPLAGVTVTANAPTQTAISVTDASGTYRFLSLGPDTYTLSFNKNGYDPLAQPGLSVFADQVQTVNVAMVKTLKTIARVTSQAAANLVKSGQVSDVYSVNAAGQAAAQGLTGPGSLNNAYGAIASVPGVALNQGEQGWWQELHIRGGDIDQVGFELDGIPVNRVYDNAPETMLSTLGSQEVQVYTGGVPASSDAQGISGYVNQVIKTGTYPGYGTLMGSVGYPAFYHQASAEVGGSTPDRLFSYYVGFGGSDEDFRYIDNNNGASIPNTFFYPVTAFPGINCNLSGACSFQKFTNGFVYTGGQSPVLFTTGLAYGLTNQSLRDTVVNLHFGIPHRVNALRDDVQAFWMTTENHNDYYSSTNDLGPNVIDAAYGAPVWDDTLGYSGAAMQPVNVGDIFKYQFPQSQVHSWQGLLPTSIRDPNENGASVSKLQYQHVFSPSEFLRVYGYSLYSTWFINGYNATAQPYYGWELPYFLPDHVYGFNLSYENQLSNQHLLTVSGAYTYSNPQRYDVTYFPTGWPLTTLVGNNGNCYAPVSDSSLGVTAGQQVGCYAGASTHSGSNTYTFPSGTTSDPTPALGYTCPGPAPACAANAQWLVTNTSFHGALNQVRTAFSGYSIGDQWRPSDKWNVNLGLRLEDFEFLFGNTSPNDPARQFWFTQYNKEYCFGAGVNNNKPVLRGNNGLGLCPSGTAPLALQPQDPGNTPTSPYGPLVDSSGGSYTAARFEPRIGLTYTVDQLSVLRASFGIYARPPNSSWVQYNVLEQNLPAYLGSHFYGFGFNTPNHIIRPDTSYNYDFSWEHRFRGSEVSFKISPFYRATRDQLQNFFIDPQGGLESGLNVGNQVTDGVELALQDGDFSRDGLSGQLAFTYTHSQIKYQNFSNSTQNVINQLNNYIQQYNSYTKACAPGGAFFNKSQYGQALCGSTNSGAAASPCYASTPGAYSYGNAVSCSAPGALVNPYYNAGGRGLLNPTAYYTTYDIIPGPVSAGNGYAVPYVTSLLLNYKHQKFAITNSWSFSSGASYGAPPAWPGYAPDSCQKAPLIWSSKHGQAVDPAMCTGLLFIPDSFTGQFDNLGTFKEPWRLQMGIALQYDVSPKVTARLNFTNILDICGQKGYAWDNPNVCVYSSPPTGFFYPAGNWYPNHNGTVPPPQMKYPYDFFFNGANTGFLGVTEPLQITGSVQIKL
jgi:hypothetical protein